MKKSEAILASRRGMRFECPRCPIKQPWLSLARHITLFHRWRHYEIDEYMAQIKLMSS